MKSFCIVVISGLVATVVAKTPPNELGEINSEGHFGILPEKYENLTERDVRFGVSVRFFIEQLREVMSEGFGSIPPLDPLTIEKPETTKFQDREVSGEIDYSNFTLRGLKSFKMKVLETRLDNGRVDFEFDVPASYFVVDYTSVVRVDMSSTFFSGLATVGLGDVHIKGAFAVEGQPPEAPPEKQKLHVVSFSYNATSESTNYNLEDHNIIASTKAGSSSDHEASEVTKALARELAKLTSESIVNTIVDGFNKFFGGINVAQVLAVAETNKA